MNNFLYSFHINKFKLVFNLKQVYQEFCSKIKTNPLLASIIFFPCLFLLGAFFHHIHNNPEINTVGLILLWIAGFYLGSMVISGIATIHQMINKKKPYLNLQSEWDTQYSVFIRTLEEKLLSKRVKNKVIHQKNIQKQTKVL